MPACSSLMLEARLLNVSKACRKMLRHAQGTLPCHMDHCYRNLYLLALNAHNWKEDDNRYRTFRPSVCDSGCYRLLDRKSIISWSKQNILFKSSHKMYYVLIYNYLLENCCCSKTTFLYQKVNYGTFWKITKMTYFSTTTISMENVVTQLHKRYVRLKGTQKVLMCHKKDKQYISQVTFFKEKFNHNVNFRRLSWYMYSRKSGVYSTHCKYVRIMHIW
jgi:hypothetical protein